jgi:ABC-2 type transport system permease protein
MQNISAIFKREFKAYFLSPIAYIFITLFLASNAFLFFMWFFAENQATMRAYFGVLPWAYLFFMPAITMRSWAEEKKMKTLELLLTWPVKDVEVVLGKFLASLGLLVIVLLLSATIPISLCIISHPDSGQIVAQYVGAVLMGAAYLAIGLWASSMTENQIIAFIVGVIATFLLFIIGLPNFTMMLPAPIVPFFNAVGLFGHFESISRGVLDSRDIIYYFSVIGFFLFLNVCTISSRKWE